MAVVTTPISTEEAMHYKTFDTHKYIKSLQETGFNEKQAEMLIKSLLESRDFDLSILATREQVTKAEARLQKEISATREQVAQVEAKLGKQIAQVEAKPDSFKWITPLIFTLMAMIAAMMVKLFF